MLHPPPSPTPPSLLLYNLSSPHFAHRLYRTSALQTNWRTHIQCLVMPSLFLLTPKRRPHERSNTHTHTQHHHRKKEGRGGGDFSRVQSDLKRPQHIHLYTDFSTMPATLRVSALNGCPASQRQLGSKDSSSSSPLILYSNVAGVMTPETLKSYASSLWYLWGLLSAVYRQFLDCYVCD